MHIINIRQVAFLAGAAILAAVLMIAGCGGPAAKAPPGPAAASGEQVAATAAKTGVQLWAEQCGRCHNLRDPAWRTADQREVAVHHMRLRVPMTGEDQREITKFLANR
jgi:hypothetical protein